eukprot:gnl/TRDRNA2_/TRDRNA2_176746_c0_seq2.p1 gnl/TRDRNA2_/TRDRNA2_176746_c0~~gnl/TRDRNA2_/TRDRNA2_176746_c0_seq2.p1  ORF type:complete len:361 (-),score=35.43 gnl/TRDRNA2_/TRDRNA2_176746_c0_seq2:625-1638(-)
MAALEGYFVAATLPKGERGLLCKVELDLVTFQQSSRPAPLADSMTLDEWTTFRGSIWELLDEFAQDLVCVDLSKKALSALMALHGIFTLMYVIFVDKMIDRKAPFEEMLPFFCPFAGILVILGIVRNIEHRAGHRCMKGLGLVCERTSSDDLQFVPIRLSLGWRFGIEVCSPRCVQTTYPPLEPLAVDEPAEVLLTTKEEAAPRGRLSAYASRLLTSLQNLRRRHKPLAVSHQPLPPPQVSVESELWTCLACGEPNKQARKVCNNCNKPCEMPHEPLSPAQVSVVMAPGEDGAQTLAEGEAQTMGESDATAPSQQGKDTNATGELQHCCDQTCSVAL